MASTVLGAELAPLAFAALYLLLIPCSWGLYWLVWPKGPDPDDRTERAIRQGKKVKLVVAGIVVPAILIWLAVAGLVQAFSS